VTTHPPFVLQNRQLRDLLTLRSILTSEGYNTKAVGGCLGAPDPDLTQEEQRSLWQWRARHNDPLSVLIRLFFLGDPVASKHLRFVGEGGLNAWHRQKWLERVGTTFIARIELSLQGDHVIACDRQDRPHRHFVAGPTRATHVLARAMLPSVGNSALDLGTGTGMLALRFGEKIRQRVATDINPRALRFAAMNAILNGIVGIELFQSDTYHGIKGQRFHQIVGNLPFVITPGQRYSFRETGLPGDTFLSNTIRETGSHLHEGGIAEFLGQWIHLDGESESSHLAAMLAKTGLDALFVRTRIEAADEHAARWLAGPETLGRIDRSRRLRSWMHWLQAQGVQAVSTGVIVLRRRKAARHFLVVDDLAAEKVTGTFLARRLAAIDRALTLVR
jgi:Methyltransferase small domain